ncbi:(4Fe-4S)-binding protein [Streptomyces sp. NPDC002740]
MTRPDSDAGDRTLRPEARRYEAPGIAVSYEARICVHEAECVRGLPAVFDVERRPWIDAGAESPDRIAEVVRRCPSGALQYHLRDGDDEQPSHPTQVERKADGTLHLRGDLLLKTEEGPRTETRVILCGCGLSANQPLCDHSGRCGRPS